MMIKRQSKNGLIAIILVAVLWLVQAQSVLAAGTLSYGSEVYTPEINGEFPVGLYLSADETIASYRVVLAYDSSKLEYTSGGELLEPGRVEVSGVGEQSSYRVMLSFNTLLMGNSELKVESIELYSDAEKTKPIEVSSAANVGIQVPIATENQLSELLINGKAIEGFNPSADTCHVTVPYNVDTLDIQATPSSPEARVTISDNKVEVGDNTLYVDVTYQGLTMRYVLTVSRESKEGTAKTEDKVSKQDEEKKDTDIFKWVKWALLLVGIILVACAVLIFVKVLEVRRRKRRQALRRLRRERREQQEQQPIVNAKTIEKKNQPEISVKDVSMHFKISVDGADSIKEYIIRAIKGQNQYRELKALDHISFDVQKGEVVGIIGTNGSGKSTILKIVSGALAPTSGSVQVDRQKVQLLTLGTGFDMELTAKENVYLNGALIGYTREYIDQKYDDIVAFAELEGFMDERMKNFSSGMVSRLGFAIATMRDTPEILILDEVLSVGDMFFQKKSLKRVKEMIHGGSTVLIVSHSANVIKTNCTRAIWIEKGVMMADGDPKKVCELYEKAGNGES